MTAEMADKISNVLRETFGGDLQVVVVPADFDVTIARRADA